MSRDESRIAFVLGFCGFFVPMILFTREYSGYLVTYFDRNLYPQLALILCAHMIVQSCFTLTAHIRQLGHRLRHITIGKFLLFAAAFVVSLFLGVLSRRTYVYHGLEMGEIVYRCFLGFYALVFPAYVWLVVLSPRRSFRHFTIAVAIAAPLFWLAMIEQKMIFAVPGILAIIIAKYFGSQHPNPDNTPNRAADFH
jgi:hypothetical protein